MKECFSLIGSNQHLLKLVAVILAIYGCLAKRSRISCWYSGK
jgi:hypothetical protein